MTHDFTQRVLERIDHEHVRPQPRWLVRTKRWLIIALLIVSVVGAAVLSSLLFLAIMHVDPAFLRSSSLGPMIHLLLSYVPFVWIALFLLVCVLEVALIRENLHAYRYSMTLIVCFVLIGASLLGGGFYFAHLPQRVEAGFQRLPPPIQPFMMRGQPIPRPEDGVLFGRVVAETATSLTLEGPRQDRWDVTTDRSDLLMAPFIKMDTWVLIRGTYQRPGHFVAQTIEPHDPPPPPPRGQP